MAGGLAVAVAVFESAAAKRVLVVRRPNEPGEELPGLWGLPAATVGGGESPEDAVRRLGRQKLGIILEPLRVLAEATEPGDSEALSMILFAARAKSPAPRLRRPARADGVTYYTDWRWADPAVLVASSEKGSLCSQLLLRATGHG